MSERRYWLVDGEVLTHKDGEHQDALIPDAWAEVIARAAGGVEITAEQANAKHCPNCGSDDPAVEGELPYATGNDEWEYAPCGHPFHRNIERLTPLPGRRVRSRDPNPGEDTLA